VVQGYVSRLQGAEVPTTRNPVCRLFVAEPGLFVFASVAAEWSSNIFHFATNPRTGRCCHREWGSTTHATASAQGSLFSVAAQASAHRSSASRCREALQRGFNDAATMLPHRLVASKRFVILSTRRMLIVRPLMEDFSLPLRLPG